MNEIAIIAEKEAEPINSGYSSYLSYSQQNVVIFLVSNKNDEKKYDLA